MSTAPKSTDRQFRFGPYEVSEREGVLRKNGVRLKLQEQPFRVLLELLSNAGQMVTREDLQQKLWPADTFVDFDTGLNTAIRKIRQALDDNADKPKFIETTPRRGYRFLVRVSMSFEGEEKHRTDVVAKAITNMVDALMERSVATPPAARSRTKYYVVTGAIIAVIAAVTVAVLVRGRKAPPALAERQITFNPEGSPVLAAIISPDGKYVAYGDTTGTYFREIDSGETHPLVAPSEGEWLPVSWFPDSTHVVLTSSRIDNSGHHKGHGPEIMHAHGIWKASILGSVPQRVVENGWGGAVSPDGRWIAFLRGDTSDSLQIVIAATDGSKPDEVLTPTPSSIALGSLSWSPHGRRIAYHRMYPSGAESWSLETIDVRTREVTILRTGGRFAGAIWWNRDGRLLYGWRPVGDGNSRDTSILAVPVNENTGAPEATEKKISAASGNIAWLSASIKPSRLAIVRYFAGTQAYVTEIDPETQTLRTPLRRVTLDQNDSFATTWTPDGRAIVFASNRTGESKLYRQNIDQSVPELLADGERVGPVRIAPDGKHFLYTVGPDAEHFKPSAIIEVPVEGGQTRTVLTRPWLVDVQCARAPATLCLALNGGQGVNIFSFDPRTGEAHPFVVPGIQSQIGWGLSPDGKTLEIGVSETKIAFLNIETKTIRELDLKEWGRISGADWDLDSQSMFIGMLGNDGTSMLLRVTSEGVARVLLRNKGFPENFYAIPAPDRNHVMVGANTGESNVWMLENF